MTGLPSTPSVPPTTVRCPRCQTELPATGNGSAQCPRCLLELALQPGSGSPANAAADVPSIAELQPLFPAYELQTLLGRGGMGAVYRARHTKLDRLVAVKVLLPDLVRDPAFAERFEREARALARLDHPGIVGIHDFGRAGEFFFLVMEFVDGANLRELLTQGHLSPRDVLAFVPQLCDALQFAHDHRVVHRDIKPENILVDQDGRVRIADFGLAKLLGQEASEVGLTQTNQTVGTPHYMAPEQVGASGNVDHRADLYSLGVVLYEMLTGRLPIGRFQLPSAQAKGVHAFDPVVMKSLENDPEQRYQQAREIKTDVEAAGADRSTRESATAPTPTPPSDTTRRTHALRGQSEQAPRAKPSIPWESWMLCVIAFIATFLPWLSVKSEAPMFGGVQQFEGNAWVSSIGIPCWTMFALAVVLSMLCTIRDMGHAIPRGSTILAASLGVIYCTFGVITCIAHDQLSPRIGLLLTCVIFVIWSILELRRRGTAKLRWQRRHHRTARDS